MRGDLHALFTSDPGCNSMRGSYPFNDVFAVDIAQRAVCGEQQGNYFEPGMNKGALARATLYFLMRYKNEISKRELPPETIKTLIRWHHENKPTQWEKHRNAEIAKVQGNRSPLIDRPEWADHIDFSLGLRGARLK